MDAARLRKRLTATDPRVHLRMEMARLAGLLGDHLRRARERGRSPAGEALQGFVIEDGEAEGVARDLVARWSENGGTAQGPARASAAWDDAADSEDGGFLPLRHAARTFDLEPVEYFALLLALAVEIDGQFGRLIAYLNDHVGRSRPTLGFAASLASEAFGAPADSPLAFADRPAVRDGLLELEGDGPAPSLTVRVPRDMALRLVAEAPPGSLSRGFRYFAAEPGLLERLILEPGIRSRLGAWAHALRSPRASAPLVLAGASGAGRATAARGALSEIGHPLLTVDAPPTQFEDRLREARREACWHGAPLLVRIEGAAAPGQADWRAFWTALADLRVPLLVACAAEIAEPLAAAAPLEPVVVAIPEPDFAARAALWRALAPSSTASAPRLADELAGRFRFNPGRIHRAVRRAAGAAPPWPSGDAAATGGDPLFEACREAGAASMGSLARKLPLPYAWDELVVPPHVQAELQLARTWIREQRTVLDLWGFARRLPLGRGLTMLFSGQPGTGKTMAAQVLARELGLDLYRVDLSRVVNKYIGETEKNLACLFDECQAAGAILFFDEADALFGKRSEVKDAHDRYANLEIGYLLQRMEEFEGVTILASNRARDMDEAFTRRFHFLIDFPMPDEAHRLRIWEGMIPREAQGGSDLDLRGLAKSFEISGGEIKNAALSAAFIAAGAEAPICTEHVRQAVRREFRKSGKVVLGKG